MEVSFTLATLSGIIDAIPFDKSVINGFALDFAEMLVPYYVKHNFKVMVIVSEKAGFDAMCPVVCPDGEVNIAIIIIVNKRFEDAFSRWQTGDKSVLSQCSRRRELYCHELCHLIAVIRAFPSTRNTKDLHEFFDMLQGKFGSSINSERGKRMLVSIESSDTSPSVFDKEHFRYEGDSLNYFNLYCELMLDRQSMESILRPIVEGILNEHRGMVSVDDVANIALVPPSFFNVFPDRLDMLVSVLRNVAAELQSGSCHKSS